MLNENDVIMTQGDFKNKELKQSPPEMRPFSPAGSFSF